MGDRKEVQAGEPKGFYDSNSVFLTGRVVHEPQMRGKDDNKVLSFDLAVNDHWTDKDGQHIKETVYPQIACFRGLAETMSGILKPGSHVVIQNAQLDSNRGKSTKFVTIVFVETFAKEMEDAIKASITDGAYTKVPTDKLVKALTTLDSVKTTGMAELTYWQLNIRQQGGIRLISSPREGDTPKAQPKQESGGLRGMLKNALGGVAPEEKAEASDVI